MITRECYDIPGGWLVHQDLNHGRLLPHSGWEQKAAPSMVI